MIRDIGIVRGAEIEMVRVLFLTFSDDQLFTSELDG